MEHRWERIIDWPVNAKTKVGSEVSTDLFEIGKVRVRVEFISDMDLNANLNSYSDEKCRISPSSTTVTRL